jgi:hypothetical protein
MRVLRSTTTAVLFGTGVVLATLHQIRITSKYYYDYDYNYDDAMLSFDPYEEPNEEAARPLFQKRPQQQQQQHTVTVSSNVSSSSSSSTPGYDDDDDDDENTFICISNGTVTGQHRHAIRLSSPFFRDFLKLVPIDDDDDSDSSSSSSGCAGLSWDGKTHVVISAKRGSQYGHLLLNAMAPLWDKLRRNGLLLPSSHPQYSHQPPPHFHDDDNHHHHHPLVSSRDDMVLHYFTKDERYLNATYIHKYLSLFAGTVIVAPASELPNLTLYARNPILGLSDITLDHYNYDNVDPELWRGFREFLMNGMMQMKTSSSSIPSQQPQQPQQLRVTFVQRLQSRRILNLDELVHAIQPEVVVVSQVKVRVVSFEDMALEEQIQVMADTDILVGADGTNLINGILYMPMSMKTSTTTSSNSTSTSTSCVISILPFGVSRHIPNKGRNFRLIHEKLGGRYRTLDSLPVPGSIRLVERALQRERPQQRWFLLKQDLVVDPDEFRTALQECVVQREHNII